MLRFTEVKEQNSEFKRGETYPLQKKTEINCIKNLHFDLIEIHDI